MGRRANSALSSALASAAAIAHHVATKRTSLQTAHAVHTKRWRPDDAAAARDAAAGTLRFLHRADALIDASLVGCPSETWFTAEEPTMRMLLAAALFKSFDDKARPVVSSRRLCEAAASAAAVLGRGKLSAHVVRVLENALLVPAPLTPTAMLSLPRWLHDDLRKAHGARLFGHYASMLLQRPDSLGLNVDPARWTPAAYSDELRCQGMEAVPLGPLAPNGVLLRSRPRHVEQLVGFAPPVPSVFVQDGVQQWAAAQLGCALREDTLVLDCCSAPGGKTKALLHHQPRLRVVALERSSTKAKLLRHVFSKDERVRVVCGDALEPSGWWSVGREGHFSAILLDAPCTGTGIMRSRPEVKLHQTAESAVALASTQGAMLSALWPLLEPGGALHYVTCSILDVENGRVVKDFAARTADAELVAPDVPMAAQQSPPAIQPTAIKGRAGVTFLPQEAHAGGFSAILRKRMIF